MCATSRCQCSFEVEASRLGVHSHEHKKGEPEHEELHPDVLARTVGLQRRGVEVFYQYVDKVLKNDNIRTVWNSSQPSHVLAAVAVGLVCSTFYHSRHETEEHPASVLLTLVYLVSTSLHLGAQFWMTFVSGLTLYFSLSRHAFGDVQKVLFPRYFTLNSMFSAICLVSFTKLHNHVEWNLSHYLQIGVIATGFLLETLARLYVAPCVVSCMAEVRELELSVEGVGTEIGRHIPGTLSESPAYIQAYSAFRRKHGAMAIANIISMACTIAHIYYLASRIQFR